MNKPIKPEITIPQSFAENGVKTDFDDTLLADGFDNLRPDVLAGDNLNKFIDDTYKGLNYGMAAADALNLINEGETLIVRNGEFTSGAAGGGGLEIGDIGIAPLGIDESKGKRRYLNGQIIIQEQYAGFTKKVKDAINLYPSLACSEDEWHATALLTVGGQVGKFVVDDDAGTIRLPKIIMPIQGLTDLSKLGEIVEAGLPNIKGSVSSGFQGTFATFNGAFYQINANQLGNYNSNANHQDGFAFDASRSSSIYGKSNTVQQEQIQYPYFIQVATGAETKDEITNEHELVNPYVLLEPKFFETPVYNLSWLISNGSFTGSKAVHPHAYDALLIELNADIEVGTTQNNYTKRGLPVKLATDSYTDYDFVVNPIDETFRPPLKVNLASSKAVVGNGMTLGITDGTTNVGLYQNVQVGLNAAVSLYGKPVNTLIGNNSATPTGVGLGVTTDPTKSGLELADSNLYLYFYVGEVAQNTNLVNAGRIEEKIASLIPNNSSLISGYGMPTNRLINLQVGASGTSYTMPANGWLWMGGNVTGTSGYISMDYYGFAPFSGLNGAKGAYIVINTPVQKNTTVSVRYGGLSDYGLYFIYAEGEV